jgi:hypothetical protein
MTGKRNCGHDDPEVPCDRETLRSFVARCKEMGKSIDEMSAVLMLSKIGDALMMGRDSRVAIDIVRHMLADYREILMDQIEQKHGVKVSDEKSGN